MKLGKLRKTGRFVLIVPILIGIITVFAYGYKSNQEKMLVLQPVETVVKDTPETWQGKAGNLSFDGVVQVPDVTAVYKWKVELLDDVFQKNEETREMFLDYFDNLDRKEDYFLSGSAEDILDTIGYSDEEGRAYTDSLEISKSGHLALTMQSDYFENEEEGNKWLVVPGNVFLPYEANYYYQPNGVCKAEEKDEYLLYDGVDKSIEKCMDELEEVMERYHSLCPAISIVPDRVAVFRNQEESCYILASHGLLTYEGVPVDDAGLVEQQNDGNKKICRQDACMWGLSLQGDKQPYMTILNYAYGATEKLESYDKIITFEQAWERLKEELPKNENVCIDRADLMYSIWFESMGLLDEDWTLTLDTVPDMYATPVWRFVSYQDAQYSYAYYVDAVTGEVSVYHHACCR